MTERDDAEARAIYGSIAATTMDAVDQAVEAVGEFHDQARVLFELAQAKGIDREQSAALIAGAAASVAAER